MIHPNHLASLGAVAVVIPNTFGYVILAGVLIALQILLIGWIFPGTARKVFSKEFLEQHFGEEHRRVTGKQIEKGGLYAHKLSYKDWLQFNNAQRAHGNYVEMAPTTLVWLFCAGIYFPIPAAVFGLVIIIGRALYAIGYSNQSYFIRESGVLCNYLSMLALLGLSFASGVRFILGDTP